MPGTGLDRALAERSGSARGPLSDLANGVALKANVAQHAGSEKAIAGLMLDEGLAWWHLRSRQ
jgi:hypothetical protein